MIYGELHIPDPIIDAQRKGELVVFAGAGISRGKPALLPDFDELVEKATGTVPKGETPLEVHLGNLAENGISVHQQISDYLRAEMSIEGRGLTPLHSAIPLLFGRDPSVIRIVSTNFDTYLSEAIPGEVAQYSAPAIPMSPEFKGLVYLHGSITRSPLSMVMTDRDFSKAYITDGWARQFLLNIYRRYTVLFIGYSHTDQLLKHLARGLDFREHSVFALTCDDEESLDHWKWLHINAIPFQDGRYDILAESVQKWAEDTQADFFQRRKQFRQVVQEGVPSEDSEEESFILRNLMTPGFTEAFTRVARGEEWGSWILEKGLADFVLMDPPPADVYDTFSAWKDQQADLGRWLVNQIIVSPVLLSHVIKRSEGKLGWPLTRELLHRVTMQDELDEDCLGRLSVLLVKNCRNVRITGAHTPLLEYCLQKEADEISLFILRELLRPRTDLDAEQAAELPAGALNRGMIGYNIAPNMLERAWEEHGPRLMDEHPKRLGEILLNALREEYDLRMALGDLSGQYPVYPDEDVISVKRSEYSRHNTRQLIANMAVDLLESIQDTDLRRSHALIEELFTEDDSVIRRIAIHLFTRDESVPPAEKLEWLLERELLFRYTEYHEVYLLFAGNLRNLPEDERGRFLDVIRDRIKAAEEDPEYAHGVLEDWIVNFFSWLAQEIPGWDAVNEFGAWCHINFDLPEPRLLPQFPQDLAMDEDDPFEGKTGTELVEWFDDLDFELDRMLLLPAYAGHIARNPVVGIEVLERLTEDEGPVVRESLITHTVYALFSVGADLSSGDHSRVLAALSGEDIPGAALYTTLSLLQQKLPVDDMSDTSMRHALTLIDRAVDALDAGAPSDGLSIFCTENSAATYIPRLLVKLLRASQNGEIYPEVWAQIRETLLKCCGVDDEPGFLLLENIGLEFYEIFRLEPVWAIENLVPLFDPESAGEEAAGRVWDGFFSIMNDREEEFRLLRDSLMKVLGTGAVTDSGLKMVGYLVRKLFRNFDGDLLNAITQYADDGGLGLMVTSIGGQLRASEEPDFHWKRWVLCYLLDRLRGIGKQLGPKEYTSIVLFAARNPDRYPEISNLIISHTGDVLPYFNQFSQAVLTSGFAEVCPEMSENTADLLRRMLSSLERVQQVKPELKALIELLSSAPEASGHLQDILEILGRNDLPWAEELFNTIRA